MLDEADLLLWATEKEEDRTRSWRSSRSTTNCEAVRDGGQVFTDGLTAGAIYFTSLLSLPLVLEHLVPAWPTPSPAKGPSVITS